MGHGRGVGGRHHPLHRSGGLDGAPGPAGDEEAQRIFRAHHDLLAEAASAHGGEEVKWLGDGLMVAFASAADAVRCAIAMQQGGRRPVHGERLAIRVGLNAGETLKEAADYFGLPVVVARRLCDRAETGQILCTLPSQGAPGLPEAVRLPRIESRTDELSGQFTSYRP